MERNVSHTSAQALEAAEGARVCLAGRVVFYRSLGKVCFGKLEDRGGRIQFSLNKRETPEQFKEWSKSIKIGSIIVVSGRMGRTSTGEFTVMVDDHLEILRHSLHPFPNKKDGILDPEVRLRKRYLDICLNPETKNVFKTRSRVISAIRRFLDQNDFMEVETPVLTPQASGAQARPFSTHHHAYDTDLFLRIAPETYLKRAIASSFDRVYEIGKNFRNEGIDPSHLQEFTSLEFYTGYADYMDNLELFKQMLKFIFGEIGRGSNFILEYQGNTLDFKSIDDIPVKTYRDVCLEFGGFDPFEIQDYKEIDQKFKQLVRPKLVQPIFIKDYPAHMSPLAQRSDDGKTVEQWQFIVNGWELVKCYTELTDPALQRQLLEEQISMRNNGDEEAMMLEEDFLECMEYGIPPCSGVGLGIDRLVALLTNQKSLRDVVLFPTVL